MDERHTPHSLLPRLGAPSIHSCTEPTCACRPHSLQTPQGEAHGHLTGRGSPEPCPPSCGCRGTLPRCWPRALGGSSASSVLRRAQNVNSGQQVGCRSSSAQAYHKLLDRSSVRTTCLSIPEPRRSVGLAWRAWEDDPLQVPVGAVPPQAWGLGVCWAMHRLNAVMLALRRGAPGDSKLHATPAVCGQHEQRSSAQSGAMLGQGPAGPSWHLQCPAQGQAKGQPGWTIGTWHCFLCRPGSRAAWMYGRCMPLRPAPGAAGPYLV